MVPAAPLLAARRPVGLVARVLAVLPLVVPEVPLPVARPLVVLEDLPSVARPLALGVPEPWEALPS